MNNTIYLRLKDEDTDREVSVMKLVDGNSCPNCHEHALNIDTDAAKATCPECGFDTDTTLEIMHDLLVGTRYAVDSVKAYNPEVDQ